MGSEGTEEQRALLRLWKAPGLGAVGIARLARHYASARGVFAAGEADWVAKGIAPRSREALVAAATLDVEAELAGVERTGAWMVGVFDSSYPAALKAIYDPPPVLFGTGSLAALSGNCVAVVGARRVTRYGSEHAYRLAKGLAEAGVTVVSGLAVGVDYTAHQAALDADGVSVAVLGSGVANVYPGNHREMAARLSRRGAVVSELLPETAADKVNFPRRNRIISGLCRAVVIVEAREDSGSLITARQGIEQGRDIYVVPGPAGGTNRGGHRLLADGAMWAEDANDVLNGLAPQQQGTPVAASAAQPGRRDDVAVPDAWMPVWQALEGETTHVDVVIERTGLRSPDVLGILLQMELHGLIRQLPNKHFQRRA